MPTGNFMLGDFSTSFRCARNDRAAWDRWHSLLQETVCEGFPILRWDNDIHGGRKLFAKGFLFGVGGDGIHGDRKLFAKGFLYGMRRMAFIATGNYLRKVSYSAWDKWYS